MILYPPKSPIAKKISSGLKIFRPLLIFFWYDNLLRLVIGGKHLELGPPVDLVCYFLLFF